MSESSDNPAKYDPATVIRGEDGVRLYCRAAGDPLHPAIVFIHGYPDSHTVWDRVVAELADDFYCVRYDVRGAGASGRPRGTTAYRLARLEADLEAVMDWASPEAPVHLVGHDWGSIQTWEAVTDARLAERIASFTSISGPCLDHAGHWLRGHSGAAHRSLRKQLRQSWYIAAFHVPLLPQLAWRTVLGRRWPRIAARMEGQALPENPTLARDGAHGVKLYRANVLPRLLRPRERHARAPVQVITPVHDAFVGPDFVEGLDRWVDDLTVMPVDAAHWAILTQPQTIARHCAEFIRKQTPPVTSAVSEPTSPVNAHTCA